MKQSRMDDRSPTAKAMSKVSEILAVCLLPVVPTLIGIWLDRKFGAVLLFTMLGLGFGLTGAFLQLKRLVSPETLNANSKSQLESKTDED